MRSALTFAACIGLLAACKSKPAEPQDQVPLEVIIPEPEEVPAWEPPEPDEHQDDWICLVSGEWLRGEIEVMRRDSLEFDSEELDTLNVDWEDVIEVRTSRLMTLGLTEDRVVSGPLMIKGGQVAVGSTEVLRFDREELLSIIPGVPTEKNYWSGKIVLGTTIRRGNTDQTDGSADLRVQRRSPSSRIEMKYNGTATRVQQVETSNAHRLDGRWDRYLNRRLYLTPFFFSAYQDRFQNTELRFTPGTGLGYMLLDRSQIDWELDAGLGYQLIRYYSVEAGESPEEGALAALLGTALSADLTKRTELILEYRLQAAFSSAIGTNHHTTLTLSVDLIGELDLDVTWVWDHVDKPVAQSDGTFPSSDDYRLQVGFGWSF